jgi:hypothetical protein
VLSLAVEIAPLTHADANRQSPPHD